MTSLVVLCVCFVGYGTLAQNLDLYGGDVCKDVQGTEWTCKPVSQCSKAIQLLKSGVRPQICSFQLNEPVVCCEPDHEAELQPPTTTVDPLSSRRTTSHTRQPQVPGLRAQQRCREYADSVFIKLADFGLDTKEERIDTCNQVESLIVGGQDARPREYPHMAQIGYGEENKIAWKCGGSLISRNYVVSAAHCTTIYRQSATWVRLGEYNIKVTTDESTGDARPVVHKILRRINHPDYRPPLAENDIALYQLETDVEFNEYIRPVCLQIDTSINRPYAIATGWGNTEYGGRASDVLQKVNLTLISEKECSEFYKPNRHTLPSGVRPDSMLCAGDTFSLRDSCQGDSGGPLQVPHPQLYCTYSLVGVTSFGLACGVKPGVYTRVSHFVPWIENIIWQ
ncbi:serine-type endopeptidase activity protein [Homalodisca vitripennis]|nr:serine-type endopeptidase activity protein [Homalodisca vitripennis]